MDITAPVTDYIQASMLTTKGDLVKRGAAANARFGIGSAGEIIRVNSTPDDLEFQPAGQFLFENELVAKNGGNVTLTVGGASMITLDLGTLAVGDRFLINAIVVGVKTTAGTVDIFVDKGSGTGTILFFNDAWDIEDFCYCPDGDTHRHSLSAMLKCSGAGTIVLDLWGRCSAGTSLVTTYSAQIYAAQFKNA